MMSFTDIEDNELSYLLRSNNDAFEYLINRYQKRIFGFIKNFKLQNCIKKLDYEDFYQECFIVFLKCLDMFDDEYNFYNYLHSAINKKLYKLWKKEAFNENIISLDYSESVENFSLLDVVGEDDYIYSSKQIEDFIDIKLDSITREIFKYKKRGYNAQEISKLIGISRKIVYKKVSELKMVLNNEFKK